MLHDNAYTVFHRYPQIAKSDETGAPQTTSTSVLETLLPFLRSIRGVKDAALAPAASYSATGKQAAAS